MSETSKAPPAILDIAAAMRTQDERITSHPQYQVKTTRRIYGVDPAYGGPVVWVDSEGDEADEETAVRLSDRYDATLEEPGEWTRTSYVDVKEVRQVFFTEQAANTYVDRHRHRLRHPEVYVESGYDNQEWRSVRDFILNTTEKR